MRKIIVDEFVSVDGVMEGPGPADDFERAGWTMPYFTEEIGGILANNMARSDAMLMGRKTYQTFEAAFSSQSDGMSNFLNHIPKYVISTTLKTANWNNSTVIGVNVIDEVAKLKQQPGKDLFINGSCTLVHSLMQHDLIDEFSLLVHPVVVGMGKRLFAEGHNATLKLTESRALSSGVVLLNYTVEKKV